MNEYTLHTARAMNCGLLSTERRQHCRHIILEHLNELRDVIPNLITVLGLKLFLFIILAIHLLKGFIAGGGSGGLVGLPILFLFRSYRGSARLNASQMQVYVTAAMTPWALKPLFGIIADTLYIGGYNKLPYMLGTTYLSILCCIILAFMWPFAPSYATCLLFGIFMQVAVVDLLTEAKYSEKITKTSEKGADILNFVWSGIFLSQIFATLFTTFLLENVAPNWIYLPPVLPLLLFMFPVYDNWLNNELHRNKDNHDGSLLFLKDRENTLARHLVVVEEEESAVAKTPPPIEHIRNCCGDRYWFIEPNIDDWTQSDTEVCSSKGELVHDKTKADELVYTPMIGINTNKIMKERDTIILALLIGGLSLVTFVMGMLQVDARILFVVSLASAVCMIIGFAILVDPITAKVQSFVIIQNMFTISVSTATFFFFTDTPEQYPEGPHFSITFYVTVMGIVGSVCALIGNSTYQAYMKHWRYRSVFIVNNCIYIVVSLLNIVLYLRWNIKWGIPDQVFVLGAEAFQDIVGAWTSMPAALIMSQLCPPGMEATTFAILAGSSNLGSSLARYQSVAIMNMWDITPSGAVGESAKFENLWKASLISTLAPIIPILLVPFLIPDALQTVPLLAANYVHTIANNTSTLAMNLSDEDETVVIEEEEPVILNI